MGKKSRCKLARRKPKDHKRNVVEEMPGHRKEVDETDSLQSCLLAQALCLAIMMIKILAEASEKEFQFPGFWMLMFIWDDYIPIVYIFGISVLRHYVTLNHFYLSGVIAFGFVPPLASSIWYLIKVYQRTREFGFPLFEDYPFGILWWSCLTISHILRCKTVHEFIKMLSFWVVAEIRR